MSLLLELKKNKNVRRIFGQRELKIIEKHLIGIKLKKSETTRLSRDIRKKFEAIKSLIPYFNEFNLKKGSINKEIIDDAIMLIKESKYFPRIKRITLFGSIVENQMTFRSDIDIAVQFNSINIKEATEFRIYVSGRVSNKIDIQVYNVLPKKIRAEIDKKGRVLYEQKTENKR